MVEKGSIQFGDYAWKTGMANWVMAGSLALAFRNRANGRDTRTPPELVFGEGLPNDESAQRDLFLRLDRVRLMPEIPGDCAETGPPLTLVLSSASHLPGGKLWRKLATDFTRLFAARVRFEQAGLLHPHPLRCLLGEKSLDNELADDEIALLAWEELKRRAVLLGADLLVQCRVTFEFVTDQSQPHKPTLPVVILSAVPGYTEEAMESRRARALVQPDPKESAGDISATVETAELNALKARLAERERNIEEREAFLMDAEARLMNKIEEQQIKEVELEQREDNIRSREASPA